MTHACPGDRARKVGSVSVTRARRASPITAYHQSSDVLPLVAMLSESLRGSEQHGSCSPMPWWTAVLGRCRRKANDTLDQHVENAASGLLRQSATGRGDGCFLSVMLSGRCASGARSGLSLTASG
jgi:hypothetical protein